MEAASRGAEPVVFVEKDPGKRRALLANTSFLTQAREVHIMPAERFVARRAGRFDTVFLDPPFGQKGTEELVGSSWPSGGCWPPAACCWPTCPGSSCCLSTWPASASPTGGITGARCCCSTGRPARAAHWGRRARELPADALD